MKESKKDQKANSRDRVLKSLNHQTPDRCPIYSSLTPQMADKLSVYLNLPRELAEMSFYANRISYSNLLTTLGNDLVCFAPYYPDDQFPNYLSKGIMENEWGMKHKMVGNNTEYCDFPLSKAQTPEDIQKFKFPNPDAKGRFRKAMQSVKKFKQEFITVGVVESTLLETATYLTGPAKFLADLSNNVPYVKTLLDKIMEINVDIGKQLAILGVDIILCGDDFANQNEMIIDPSIWREVFKPRIKNMFQEFRKTDHEVKLAWRSKGAISQIIPDFIEIGLDVLFSVQPSAQGMEPLMLKENYGKDLVFCGGIDVQEFLLTSKPKDVKAEISRIVEILGKDGGFILAPNDHVAPNIPAPNLIAMYEFVKGDDKS